VYQHFSLNKEIQTFEFLEGRFCFINFIADYLIYIPHNTNIIQWIIKKPLYCFCEITQSSRDRRVQFQIIHETKLLLNQIINTSIKSSLLVHKTKFIVCITCQSKQRLSELAENPSYITNGWAININNQIFATINPLNPELNSICYFLPY